MENILPILIADDPEALFELCGVNLLERLLRILQRLGFRRALVLSTTPEIIGAEVAKHSWAREKVIVHVVSGATGPLTPQVVLEQGPSARFLIVPQNITVTRVCLPRSARKIHPPRLSIPIRRNSRDLRSQIRVDRRWSRKIFFLRLGLPRRFSRN